MNIITLYNSIENLKKNRRENANSCKKLSIILFDVLSDSISFLSPNNIIKTEFKKRKNQSFELYSPPLYLLYLLFFSFLFFLLSIHRQDPYLFVILSRQFCLWKYISVFLSRRSFSAYTRKYSHDRRNIIYTVYIQIYV